MTMRNYLVGLCACSIALLATGCGDDSGDPPKAALSEATASSYEGIYELSVRSLTEGGCDDGGQSLLPVTRQKLFVIARAKVLGMETVQLESCEHVSGCRAQAAAIHDRESSNFEYGMEYSAMLTREISAEELHGFYASSGYPEVDSCVEREYVDHVLTRDGTFVRLTSDHKALADRPSRDGLCMARNSDSAMEAENAPCARREVLAGTRIAEL